MLTRRRVIGRWLGALAAVACVGCGSGSEGSSSASARPVTAETVITPPNHRFTPTRSHTWGLKPDSEEIDQLTGQRLAESDVQLTIALGKVIPATATPPTGFEGLTSACEIDAEHDALLPLRATLSNHGPVALDTTLSFAVTDVRAGVGDVISIEAATTFSADSPQCQPIGDGDGSTTLEYASVKPSESLDHDYLLVLPKFYSPNYDSGGNLPALQHMVGSVNRVEVYVVGDSPNNAVRLDAVSCYSGPPHQAVDGPGAPANGLHVAEAIGPPPAGVSPILPDFVLVEHGFDYTATPNGAEITEPTGYTAC